MKQQPTEREREPTDDDFRAIQLAHLAYADAVYNLRQQVFKELADELGMPVDQVAKLWQAGGCT